MTVVNFFEKLSQDFYRLLNDTNNYDTIIQAGKERSPYFSEKLKIKHEEFDEEDEYLWTSTED
ncbi:24721_t:CDS:2, partial [Gigaspora margarita]